MRPLQESEIVELLAADAVARLATVDADGYPHVTPMWFLWTDGRFHLASNVGRPHLRRIQANPRVGLVIDLEDNQRPDGQRPNRQIRVTGDATVTPDVDARWSMAIRRKYIDAGLSPEAINRPLVAARALVTVTPRTFQTVASV